MFLKQDLISISFLLFFVSLFLKDPFHDSLCRCFTLQFCEAARVFHLLRCLQQHFGWYDMDRLAGTVLVCCCRVLHREAENLVHHLSLQLCRELVCPG